MFYCDNCRIKEKWPESIGKSLGKCEVCGKNTECHDRPSSSIPVNMPYYSKAEKGQQAQLN